MFRMLLGLVGNLSYTKAQVDARNVEAELTRQYRMVHGMNGRRFKCGPHKWTVYAKSITAPGREGVLIHAKLVAAEDRIQWP